MLPWIFHESISFIGEIFQMIFLFVVCVVTGSSSSYYETYEENVNYRPSKGQDWFPFILTYLLCKMTFNGKLIFKDYSHLLTFICAALRVYIFMGIWTLFKSYRDRRVAT